jgi:hypothetical protein
MKFPKPKFSLRTLLILVLLIGSAGGLWYRWAPWHEIKVIPANYVAASENRKQLLTVIEKDDAQDDVTVWDFDLLQEVCKIKFEAPHSNRQKYTFTPGDRWVLAQSFFDDYRPDESFLAYSRLFDAETGQDVFPNEGEITQIRAQHGGRQIGVSYTAKSPEIWVADDGRLRGIDLSNLRRQFGANFDEELPGLIFTPDGSRMFRFGGNYFNEWDTATGATTRKFNQSLSSEITDLSGDVLLHSTEAFQQQPYAFIIPENLSDYQIATAARNSISPDGRYFIHCVDHGVHVYDLRNRVRLLNREIKGSTSRVQWGEHSVLLFTDFVDWSDRNGNRCTFLDLQSGIVQTFDGEISCISADGKRLMQSAYSTCLVSAEDRQEIQSFDYRFSGVSFSADGEKLALRDGDVMAIWARRRPEYWWGIAWLPEAWLVLATGLGLVWSLVRDWKDWRRAATGEAI